MTERVKDDLGAKLKPYVAEIEAAAHRGDEKASRVIELHQMYVSCPEPGAAGLCSAAFEEWLRALATTPPAEGSLAAKNKSLGYNYDH